jgi:methylmalonyl-CoA/ethylmalonyl-CoA epimerase
VNRVHQIAQHCDDMDRAVQFYGETLGMPLIARFDPPGLAFFDLGNSRLLLEKAASPALIYFEVDNVDASRAQLIDAGVRFVDEPHMIFRDEDGTFDRAGTEEWMSFFHDSEGNMLALVERRHS